MKPSGTLVLKRSDLAGLLTFADYVGIVENGFRAHAEGRAMLPQLMHADAVKGEFHIKAGGLNGDRPHFAVKVNSSFFGNRESFGLPNIQGMILLFDAANGYPLCIMDSMEITVQRTGAATSVAAKYLARPDSSVCTICGLGNQGRVQLKAVSTVLPIRVAHVWDIDSAKAQTFARSMSEELGLEAHATGDLDAAAIQSDVIVTCTPSRQPFLMKRAVRPGTFIAAVGADSVDKQELETQLVASSKIIGDLVQQIELVGETHHAIQAGLLSREGIYGQIGEIIAGLKPGRTSSEEIIIFDSTGTAMQDVSAAFAVYQAALEASRGTVLDVAS